MCWLVSVYTSPLPSPCVVVFSHSLVLGHVRCLVFACCRCCFVGYVSVDGVNGRVSVAMWGEEEGGRYRRACATSHALLLRFTPPPPPVLHCFLCSPISSSFPSSCCVALFCVVSLWLLMVRCSAGVQRVLFVLVRPPPFFLFSVVSCLVCVCVYGCVPLPLTSRKRCTAVERRGEVCDAQVSGERKTNKSIKGNSRSRGGGGGGSSLPFTAA